MSPVAELARALVRIPSVNPEGEEEGPHTGEGRMAAFLKEWLEARGAECRLDEVLPGRPNVVARFPSHRPGKPRLLLAPHTDTVGVAGMEIEPFEGVIRDGRLYGRGATDTKGPMAAMLTALDALGSAIAGLPWEIWFAGLMGEETRQLGSHHLAAREHFDFVIAGEPTELQVVWAHKGSHRWRLEFFGRAAHSSTPHAGNNAIERAIEAWHWLRQRFEESAQPSPTLGSPTLSLGILRGGSRVNVVPDFCEMQVDIRTVPGFDAAALAEEFRARFPAARLEESRALPLETDPGHPLIRHLTACGAPRTVAPWFCDAASFAARGMAAVALGPGSIAQAHTANEFIPLEALEKGARFFEAFLRSLPDAPL